MCGASSLDSLQLALTLACLGRIIAKSLYATRSVYIHLLILYKYIICLYVHNKTKKRVK